MRDDGEAPDEPPRGGFADRVVRFFAGPPGWLDSAPVTRIAVWINLLVFAGELLYAHRLREAHLIAALPERVLLAFGGNYALGTVREHRWEALVASCFVHASALHVAVNLMSLRNVGPLVERMAGSARMAPLLLASGALGSAASAAVGLVEGGERLSIGASGALFGVLGAALVAGWRLQGFRGHLTQTMLRWLVFWLGFGVLVSSSQFRIDNAAHTGGAAGGIVVALTWRRGKVYSPRARRWVFGACAAIVGATGLVTLARAFVSPYGQMVYEARLGHATAELLAGDCPAARRASDAAARLKPVAPETTAVRTLVAERCGARPPRL